MRLSSLMVLENYWRSLAGTVMISVLVHCLVFCWFCSTICLPGILEIKVVCFMSHSAKLHIWSCMVVKVVKGQSLYFSVLRSVDEFDT